MPISKHTIAFIILFIASLFIPATWAFLSGLIYAIFFALPYASQVTKFSKTLLQISVVGLGFGVNAYNAIDVGTSSIFMTITTILFTLIVGIYLGRYLRLSNHGALLIASGTAICGGSAIAAVSSVINAKASDTSLALATVFGLNAVALFMFPTIGHWLGLDEQQFGLWSAIAIHDTSSVVGAAQVYGAGALSIATTVKLQRALWIIPLVLSIAYFQNADKSTVKIPWFIGFFVLAMLLNTFLPMDTISEFVTWLARKALTVTLFLIGASFQFATLKVVGAKPLILGVVLWVMISVGSLLMIL